MATQLIFSDNPGSLPASYVVPAGLSFDLEAVYAKINGAGAASSFLPCLTVLSQDGHVIARVKLGDTYATGDTGDASWSPFLRRVTTTPTPSGGGLDVIFDSTLGAAAASFDTNTILGGNIPQTYAGLHWQLTGRSDNNTFPMWLEMRFNNDSGANYDWERLFAHAGGIGQDGATGSTSMLVGQLIRSSDGANRAAGVFAEIPNYAGTDFWKAMPWQGAFDQDTTRLTQSGFGEWKAASAVTRIAWFPTAGNFVAGTRCTLWGMRAT